MLRERNTRKKFVYLFTLFHCHLLIKMASRNEKIKDRAKRQKITRPPPVKLESLDYPFIQTSTKQFVGKEHRLVEILDFNTQPDLTFEVRLEDGNGPEHINWRSIIILQPYRILNNYIYNLPDRRKNKTLYNHLFFTFIPMANLSTKHSAEI